MAMRMPVLNLCVFLVAACLSAQVAAVAPAAPEVIHTADDYASRAFQDPWDMSQRTDMGWYTLGVDAPNVNLSGISFAGGIFSATAANADPNFWLLDTGNPYAVNTGKTGKRFPIVSSKYKRLVMRMSLNGAGLTTATPGQAQVLWSNNTIYSGNVPPGGINTSNAFFTWPGWWIYSVNMQTLGVAVGSSWTSANVDSLRVDPLNLAGVNLSLDWARLVEDVPALYRNIQWTGSGAVDIFLDNDTNSSNGFLGQIARATSGNSFAFYVGGLPQGTYYVVICPAGAAASYSYASGSWQIQDIPLLSFTSPSPEGSSDDFATTQLSNPWDMNAASDIDTTRNINSPQIVNLAAQNEQGDALGNVRVWRGTSVAAPTAGWGDPYAYPLWFYTRGMDLSIDTSRYRILTLEMGVAGDRDINAGSIARVVWKNKGESGENVSDDIILNHLASANVIQKINLDMKTLTLDPDSSPSRTGWTGLVDNFRVDPHEFPDARQFWIKSIKLTALERAASTYTVRWSYNAQGATGVSLALFYDTTGTGFGGTPIAAGLDPASGTYVWNVAAVPNGTYFVYGVFSIAGSVVNQAYAPWPLVVDHAFQVLPTITLGRTTLNIGATRNGATTTAPQEISVTVNGAGAVNWSVTTNRSWLVATPASGSGNGRFTIRLQSNAIPAPSFMDGTVTVTATGAANSPLYVHVFLNTLATGATAVPFGVLDTPEDNTTGIAGSIAVTGWALDDVGVKSVTLWRDPVGPEAVHSNGYVYIADAFFVPGSRTDVEGLNPGAPANYRAGWGYLMLTTGLRSVTGPQGNGVYKLHAIATDEEGNQFKLGSKTITVDNLNSKKPFGALDTPAPGETVSGTILNWGWAMTPKPAAIAVDGLGVWVGVDGVNFAHPVYGLRRDDIASSFPGYLNSDTGVGYYFLDTTRFTNGLHNLGWLIYDNLGRGDGVGSRFIQVQNSLPVPAADPVSGEEPGIVAERAFHLRTARLEHPAPPAASYPAFRRGFHLDAPLTPIRQGGDSLLEPIDLKELDRLEIHLPAGPQWTAALRVGDELRALPIGSTFDTEGGIFYWQLGPAFLGEFLIEFRATDATVLPVPVYVGRAPGRNPRRAQ